MTTIPKGATVPDDHKKSAVQLEAEGIVTMQIEWRGHTFQVPASAEDWEVTTSLAFEEGKAVSGVRGVLGAAQWAELLKTKPLNRDLNNLFETIGASMGLGTSGE